MKISCDWTNGDEHDVNDIAQQFAQYWIDVCASDHIATDQRFSDIRQSDQLAALQNAFRGLRVIRLPEPEVSPEDTMETVLDDMFIVTISRRP